MADNKNNQQDSIMLEQSYNEYLDKTGIRKQIKEATIKLIENKPSEPMLFLAEYFDNLCSVEKNEKIQTATQVLKLAHFSKPNFQTNLMIAYDILSAPKNPNSKKSAYNRSGLIGMVYDDVIKEITENVPENLQPIISDKICARPNEMIPFDVFKYGIHVAYMLVEFLERTKEIFHLLQGKDGVDKEFSEIVIQTFEKSIKTSTKLSDPTAILNANKLLRPDALALAVIETKKHQNKEFIDEEEFVFLLVSSYLNNVQGLQ